MTRTAHCLNPPQAATWNQWRREKQRKGYTSWTGTWLGPLFSILTHWLCSCQGRTCDKRRGNPVSGGRNPTGRETSCQMPSRRGESCFFTHSLISSLYLIALYLDSTVRWPILDARGSAMKQQLLVALTVNGADSGKQQSTPGITWLRVLGLLWVSL